jgi:predicted phage baseplate assembly protein
VLALTDRQLRIAEMQIAARPGDVLVALRTRAGGFDFAQARIDRIEARPPPAEQHPHQLISFDGTWGGTMPPAGGAWPDDRRVVVLSRRAALFGYNAPTFRLLSEDVRRVVIKDFLTDTQSQTPTEQQISAALGTRREWPKLRPYVGDAAPTNQIDLDAVYPEAFRGRHVLLTPGSGNAELYRIDDVREVSRTEHGITSRVSRLTLDRKLSDVFDTAAARSTSVLIETEQVTPARVPLADLAPSDQAPDRIALATPCTLPAERVVVVRGRGRRAGTGDALAPLAEVARVARLEDAGVTLVLTAALANRYDPQTLEVLGNAVGASHGETRMLPTPGAATGEVQPEILGGGDARRAHPAYALRQPGLTHLPAPTAAGYAPAIEVRVDGVERPRVDSLYGRDESDRGYAVELGPDRPARVRFAARLRTGADNVTAVYRVGGGAAGVLDPDRLKLPLTMPAGLRGVTNPVAATGGKDAEGMESARANAPVRIVTLDRIVSLADYAAFARAYAGISQAEAALVWDGRRQVVVVTIAGPDGASVPTDSDLYEGLAAAMKAASAPGRPFRLFDYAPMRFGATVALAIAPGYRREVVESAVRAALGAGFGPAARRFGEPVARSRLLACAQAVGGVRAARVDGLSDGTGAAVAGEVLGADEATGQHGVGLLLLDPAALVLTELAV